MRLIVFLISLLVVSWGALAAAQDQDAQPEPTPAPDTDAAAPDDASESSPTEPDTVPEETTPSDDAEADASVDSEDQSRPDTRVDAEAKSEQEAEEQQPPPPPPSITPQVVAPAPSADVAIPGPDEAQGRLEASVPRSVRTEERKWTASQPVLTLHGYMRMRGELQDTFWLGRVAPSVLEESAQPEPFSRFIPLERRPESVPANCGDCDVDTLQFANMRLRLAPQLNISDDVRVKMMFDMFDNMVAGSTPVSYYGTYDETPSSGATEAFSSTDVPPDGSGLGDSVVVRRAWGEVRNRSLGELRFGRMPNHWGLGIMNNAGNELDDDFSSEIDKLMLITKLVGIYFTASYDFMFEGFLKPNDSTGLVSEVNQLDDVDQFTFTVSRRLDAEKQRTLLERGGVALNGGVYFSYREQDYYTLDPTPDDFTDGNEELRKLGADMFTWDVYGELRWEGLRLGYEASFTHGDIDKLVTDNPDDTLDILQFGTAFEFEYRLLDEKLGLYFDTGFASGDASVEGLSSYDNYIDQQSNNNTVSTFRFHPAYRIDLILWRSIMRQITGAYYFRPGINYDFIRNQFGQLFGARLNVLWSRAAVPEQTWGDDPDLGVEINLSLYWRSEDGPELIDGFHAMVQWGILFPMQGLGYTSEDRESLGDTFDDLEIPNALRVVLGIVY